MNEKSLVWVTIYRDNIPGWPAEACETDNLCEIPVPIGILRRWYRNEIMPAWDGALTIYDFDTWYRDLYTADDTDGLFRYAEEHGYYPEDIIL